MLVSLLGTESVGKLVVPQLVQKFTAFYINQRSPYRIRKMLSLVQIFGHMTPMNRSILILSHLFLGRPSGVVPCGLPTELYIHLLCLWCVQHAPPISSVVLSPWSYLTRTTSPEAPCVFFSIYLLWFLSLSTVSRRILLSDTLRLCCPLIVTDKFYTYTHWIHNYQLWSVTWRW